VPFGKQKIGNILYWLSIGISVACIAVLLLSPGDLRAPMGDSDEAIWSIWIAVAMAIHFASCILTGEAGMRTIVVKREENPAFFKGVIGFYCLIAVAFLIAGLTKILRHL
jgi:hypothetical protein